MIVNFISLQGSYHKFQFTQLILWQKHQITLSVMSLAALYMVPIITFRSFLVASLALLGYRCDQPTCQCGRCVPKRPGPAYRAHLDFDYSVYAP